MKKLRDNLHTYVYSLLVIAGAANEYLNMDIKEQIVQSNQYAMIQMIEVGHQAAVDQECGELDRWVGEIILAGQELRR